MGGYFFWGKCKLSQGQAPYAGGNMNNNCGNVAPLCEAELLLGGSLPDNFIQEVTQFKGSEACFDLHQR